MSNKLIDLILSVEHENCWTKFVGNYMVKTLQRSVDTEKNFIRTIIVINKKNKDLIGKIKKTASFIGYSSLIYTNDKKKILFDFRKRYKDSVMETIHSLDGIILDGFKYDGKEYWRILIWEDYIKELKDKLASKGKMELLGFQNIDIDDADLTAQELSSLVLAYKNGYFDFPRKIKSEKVAKLINISKSTFTYHLRSAESKIIKKYIDELKFHNVIHNIKQKNKDEE